MKIVTQYPFIIHQIRGATAGWTEFLLESLTFQ